MNKIATTAILAAVLAGCRTPITPEQSWADYCRYYKPTGVTAVAPTAPAQVRRVKTKEADAVIASLEKQGVVVLGQFVIADDTDITQGAVDALATKLNASDVVWTTENVVAASSALPNPDQGIVGVDNIKMAQMNADRHDQSFAEQIITYKHTIWMLGKKGK